MAMGVRTTLSVSPGSIGVGLVGGRELRFGRYGFPISDEGRSADIGLQAIRRVLHAADQRGETSPLLDEVLVAFDPSTRNCFDRTVMQEALLRVSQASRTPLASSPAMPRRPLAANPIFAARLAEFQEANISRKRPCMQCGKFLSEMSSIDHGVGAGHARLSLSPYQPWPSSVTESSERSR
jgi:hypothetical protein